MKSHKRNFIPAQKISGSNKELFIIHYEGATIELQRTSNLYEPLIVRLNGALLDTIPSKQNKELVFNTPAGQHKLQVWNERFQGNLIPKIFVKDGIAAVIDGIPVQNTLADPFSRIKSTSAFIWLLTILLFLKAFMIPLSLGYFSPLVETNIFLIVNIFLFILSLSAALTFQLNPIRATWLALIVSILDLIDYTFSVGVLQDFNIFQLLLFILRLGILTSLILSLRNLKHILNSSAEEYQGVMQNIPFEDKAKRYSFPKKYVVISLFSIAILVGGYFALTEIIKSSKYPALERDSSLAFRTDLKLPELIPYRKGNLWGYADNKGNLVIKPQYSYVEFPKGVDRLIVLKDDLFGVINFNGDEIIPCIYKHIVKIDNKYLYIVSNENNYDGIINENNDTIIPFKYSSLYYEQSHNFLRAKTVNFGVIDFDNKIKIPFIYSSLSIHDKYIIATKIINNSKRSGLLNLDGSVLLPFNYNNLEHNPILDDTLLVSSSNFNIYIQGFSEPIDQTSLIIIDTKGNRILPAMSSNKYVNSIVYLAELYAIPNSSFISARQNKYSLYDLSRDYKCGIINSSGEVIVPFEYEDFWYDFNLDDEYLCVKKNGLYGVITYQNRLVLPTKYSYISLQESNGDYYCVVEDSKLNKTGLLKLPAKYSLFSEYQIIIPFEYDNLRIDSENNNWIKAVNGYLSGVVDTNNNITIPFEYLNIHSLSDQMAAAKFVAPDTIKKYISQNSIKNINLLEEIHRNLLLTGYDESSGYHSYNYFTFSTLELVNALSDTLKRRKYFDDNSAFLLKRFTNYEQFSLSIVLDDYLRKLSGKWGFFDNTGKLIIDFIYDDVKEFQNGYAIVKYNEKWGVINKNGDTVIPIKYNNLSQMDNYELYEIKLDSNPFGFRENTSLYVDINGFEYFQD